jgi:hypothetical protein
LVLFIPIVNQMLLGVFAPRFYLSLLDKFPPENRQARRRL